MTRLTRKLLIAFALLGLVSSTASAVVHYRLLTRPGYTSFCDISQSVSCTQAYLSPYGSFAGVPIAIGGVVFFALVLVLAWQGGRAVPPVRDNLTAYIFALSTVGLAFVLYLAWASFFQLKAFCDQTARARRARRSYARHDTRRARARDRVRGRFRCARGRVPARGRNQCPGGRARAGEFPAAHRCRAHAVRGVVGRAADGAKVLVVKFNDYQCPPCRQSFESYKGIQAKYEASGQVKFVLKHFPLEGECNPAAPNGTHTAACEAAAAVNMARNKGTAPKLEQWLFDNQGTTRADQLTGDQVRQAAQEIAGIPDYTAQYDKFLVEVKNDVGMGQLLGVSSTPTFFINGRRIAGMLQPRAFDAAIALELQRAK